MDHGTSPFLYIFLWVRSSLNHQDINHSTSLPHKKTAPVADLSRNSAASFLGGLGWNYSDWWSCSPQNSAVITH
jgi:hypothetical protein